MIQHVRKDLTRIHHEQICLEEPLHQPRVFTRMGGEAIPDISSNCDIFDCELHRLLLEGKKPPKGQRQTGCGCDGWRISQ